MERKQASLETHTDAQGRGPALHLGEVAGFPLSFLQSQGTKPQLL